MVRTRLITRHPQETPVTIGLSDDRQQLTILSKSPLHLLCDLDMLVRLAE
jgi:hypothetical protein